VVLGVGVGWAALLLQPAAVSAALAITSAAVCSRRLRIVSSSP